MRVITWNVAGRVTRHAEQAEAVAAVAPDVVALQEVTAKTAPWWREALAAAGLAHCAGTRAEPPRRLGVLTAAREPLRELPKPDDLPWPERVLCTALGELEIVNVHSPISPSPGLAKVLTHEVMAAYLGGRAAPAILCGDLNTPRRELPDGELLTFAHDSKGRLREERGERWNQAERALVRDLGWVDAYRVLHGYGQRSASWTYAHDRGGYRLDHVLLNGLTPRAAEYVHDWRRAGLSDHSALVVELDWSVG
jgi:exodeoxyribonuclease III